MDKAKPLSSEVATSTVDNGARFDRLCKYQTKFYEVHSITLNSITFRVHIDIPANIWTDELFDGKIFSIILCKLIH